MRLALSGLIGLVTLAGCERDGDPRPNVLLLVVEGVRADHLGSYGYRRRKTSPHFDELAKSSLRFSWAYTAAAGTAPAVASILTGVAPAGHGVRRAGDTIDTGIETLAESFRGAGFSTGAVVDTGELTADAGFARGFDSFELGGDPLALLDRLETKGEPWFAFVHEDSGKDGDEHWLDPERYDARLASADTLLGRLVARLGDLGVDRHTLLVVTADHGVALGERGLPGTRTLHEEAIHVPLLLRPPRGVEQRAIVARVSLLSLAPTLLELSGIEHAPSRFAATTLSEWLFGDPASPRTPPVFSELGREQAVIDERYKLILRTDSGEGWVYDLAADPHERRDIAARRPQLRERLERLVQERAVRRPRVPGSSHSP